VEKHQLMIFEFNHNNLRFIFFISYEQGYPLNIFLTRNERLSKDDVNLKINIKLIQKSGVPSIPTPSINFSLPPG